MDPNPVGDDGGDGIAVDVDVADGLWDFDNLLEFDADDGNYSSLFQWPTSSDPIASPPLPPAAATEEQQEEVPAGKSRARKRDPRLVCPNFLAGRVPCACPEEDEAAAAAEAEELGAKMLAGARKRARAPRGGGIALLCQVPGCEADIRELKGYHRRHRVCLRCAHAAAVVIEGVQKRFCQQCGKFHILPDFDEGKRSCRRKLEWHNRRRRRKYDQRCNVETENEDQMDPLTETIAVDEPKEDSTVGLGYDSVETVVDKKVLERETPVGSEDVNSCTLTSLQNEKADTILTFGASSEARAEAKVDNVKPPSVVCNCKCNYAPPYPTGRVSFKLFDWNPAEFPRRLRHQIFEWLSSMPVELEGYIRPGCTILTCFIAMPQFMWRKLSQDTPILVKDLLNAPDSLLSGRGTFYIYVNSLSFQLLEDGTSLKSVRVELRAPKILFVHPMYFEVGEPTEFVVCGRYLDQPKFRSLVSHNGKYIKHTVHRVNSSEVTDNIQNKGISCGSEHEIFRISIIPAEEVDHGPGFIEVENASGLSNFVPILFGSRLVCSELERIEKLLGRTYPENNHGLCGGAAGFPEMLLDIAWLLKRANSHEINVLSSAANIQRLRSLFSFLVRYKFISITELIINSLEGAIIRELPSDAEKVAPILNILSSAKEMCRSDMPDAAAPGVCNCKPYCACFRADTLSEQPPEMIEQSSTAGAEEHDVLSNAQASSQLSTSHEASVGEEEPLLSKEAKEPVLGKEASTRQPTTDEELQTAFWSFKPSCCLCPAAEKETQFSTEQDSTAGAEEHNMLLCAQASSYEASGGEKEPVSNEAEAPVLGNEASSRQPTTTDEESRTAFWAIQASCCFIPAADKEAQFSAQAPCGGLSTRWQLSQGVHSSGVVVRLRVATILTIGLALCFAACVVIFHPHGVSEGLAVPIKRYLFGDSTL